MLLVELFGPESRSNSLLFDGLERCDGDGTVARETMAALTLLRARNTFLPSLSGLERIDGAMGRGSRT